MLIRLFYSQAVTFNELTADNIHFTLMFLMPVCTEIHILPSESKLDLNYKPVFKKIIVCICNAGVIY